MESPVRIKTGLCVLFGLLLLVQVNKGFPKDGLSKNIIESDDVPEESALNVVTAKTGDVALKFQPRNNTWLYQRRNMTNILPTTTINSSLQPSETTPNYGNKITFRGSVKYFATRPPFKPKSPYSKRNSTKSDSSEKSEEKVKVPSVNKVNITEIKLPYRRRNNTVTKNISSESSTLVNTTSLPVKEETTEKLTQLNLPNDLATTTVKYNDKVNRSDSGKSFNFDFNIDKYTSADFHDVNNVYSQSVSPEIERFVVPSSVSDYFVHVGSDSYPRYDYRSPTTKELTTPHTDYFDKRFKEVSEGIKQNLEEASQDNMSITENYFEETPSSTMNFEDLLARRNEDNATIMFKNTKELIFTDSKDAQSIHGEYTDTNGTKMYFEMSSVTTEKYPISTKKYVLLKNQEIKENEETSTLQSIASNEVIHNVSKFNITKRIDSRNNGTRKPYLTTIRMRTPTTPKPKMRILIKNNTSIKNNVNDTKEKASTTRSTPYVRVNQIIRRRNITGTTVPSKIDPIFQLDNSPTRISNTDNTIPTLNKRGSSMYFETSTKNTSNTKENDDVQFSLPPTATAWALVSMKNTPVGKKVNKTQTNGHSGLTKTEEELQQLDKMTSGFIPMYHQVPTISSSTINIDDITDDDDSYEDGDEQDVATSATKLNYTMVLRPTVIAKLNQTLNKDKMLEGVEETKTDFESITKFPETVTTPSYESSSDSSTLDFTSEEGTYPTENDLFNPMTGDIEFSSMAKSKESESTTLLDEEFATEVATTPYDDFTATTENYSDFSTEKTTTIKLSSTLENQGSDITTTKQNIDMMSSDSISQTTTEIPATENDLKITTLFESTTQEQYETTTYPNTRSTYYNGMLSSRNNIENKFITEKTLTTTPSPNSVYTSTLISKSDVDDMFSASTIYYSPSNSKVEISTPFITTESHLSMSTKINKPSTLPNLFNSEEDVDSREGKKNTLVVNEDNGLTTNDEDWIEAPDPTTNIEQYVSNEIPVITNPQNDSENDLTDINLGDNFNVKDKDEVTSTTLTPSTMDSIIEVIERESVGLMPNNDESTTLYLDDIGGKYESSVGDSGAVAAITISVIGVIALLLIVGLLIVVRGRKRSGGYGQRCTPVSLDSYSLDNVSVTGSMRRKGRGPSKRSYGNPAYDESGATSHPMQFAALANFALDQDSIVNEFNEIPIITAKADEVPPGCETKNRYSNVIPLPETRVILRTQPGDDTSDYINANYVRGPKSMKNYYIASQAPLASTVNDFWRMIWEQNSRVILMLTELMENGTEKCFEYLPPSEVSDSRRSFGDYQVVLKKREVRDKYVISTLQLKSLTSNMWREVTHLWYFWPAKGVPEECNSIIAFLIEARSYLKASQSAKDYDQDGQDSSINQNGTSSVQQVEQDDNSNGDNDVHVYNVQKSEHQIKNGAAKNGAYNDNTEGRKKSGPLVIHCSPGTGRTGTLIACDIGIRDFEMSRTVDVPKTVYRIRRDRANAVQTKDQYIFIYKVLSEYATKLTGGILDSI